MKVILVTGATGFLGKHLVEQLRSVEPGARLRLLSRGETPWDRVPQIEAVRGDITSAADVLRAAQGVNEIYHLAGIVSRDPQQKAQMYQVHVDGTRNICEAARTFGVGKVVVVSSSGTIAVSHEPVVHAENAGYKNDIVGQWPYYLSKIFAEKLAFSYARQWQLPIVVANPSLVLGSGDDRRSSTGDIALFLEGQVLAIPLGGLNFVDARDAASGLIAAMRSGRPGERYLLGGPNWTFRELIENVARIAGRRAPKMQLSLGMSLAGARIMRAVYGLFGGTFRLDEVSIRMSALFWYCSSEKARQELGFTTREPEETLRATVEDLRRR